MTDAWLERVNRALRQYDMGLLDVRGVAEVLESKVTDERVERAAEAIWNLNPMPSWRTWQERVHLEKVEHRGDKSWRGPVDRCRAHARAALEAEL
ncbi:hypothetical protein [Microbacterium arborescens]|uniref:hypothetical protein n=1 Tax=Microbacterium arborescens TaxID=33883 RepID=UPI00278490DE|nr:hypothetical protein [Microbacterium arborescens]MDQ1215719.1 hypothetical protein [Microbacterium arborescens]